MDSTGPLWQKGKLVDKVVSGMTSAGNPHGGQEGTLLALYKSMMHWGAVIANPGYSDPVIFETGGNPYGFSTVGGSDLSDKRSEERRVGKECRSLSSPYHYKKKM